MVATVANILAWIFSAVLVFLLLKDFISVERESRILERQNSEGRRTKDAGQ